MENPPPIAPNNDNTSQQPTQPAITPTPTPPVQPPPRAPRQFKIPLGPVFIVLAIIGLALLFGSGGFLVFHDATLSSTNISQGQPTLQPSAVGNGQCQAGQNNDGSVYAQIAVKVADCNWVPAVAEGASSAKGKDYTTYGWLCDSTKKSNEAQAWSGTYYSYSCVNGKGQVAFNWGSQNNYIYGESSGGSGAIPNDGYIPPSTPNQYVNGALQPTQVGDGECYADTLSNNHLYAQIAVTSGDLCNSVPTVAQGAVSANGANYTVDGYSCTATPETSSNAEWSSYWSSAFVDYSCKDGSNQIAFNYGNVNDSTYYE